MEIPPSASGSEDSEAGENDEDADIAAAVAAFLAEEEWSSDENEDQKAGGGDAEVPGPRPRPSDTDPSHVARSPPQETAQMEHVPAPPRREEEPSSRASEVARAPHVKEPVERIVSYPPYGEIRYNSKLQIMVAHCHCKDAAGNQIHGNDCRKRRTVKEGRSAGQGRPVGLLAAWLQDGANHRSQFEHCHWSVETLTWSKRRRARADFMRSCGGPAQALAAKERQKVAAEESEPEDIP